MKIIFTDSLEVKIELFFDIIDSDGNGLLDYDEVKEICELSLFEADKANDTREEVANYFTAFIFKIFDLDFTEEIPLQLIKEEIFKEDSPHQGLLCMFCCAENIIKNNYKNKKKIKEIVKENNKK